MRIGATIGMIGYRVSRNRRHITETNIDLCFPELDQDEKNELVRAIFRSTGTGVVETGVSWIRNVEDYRDLVTIHGLEHLASAHTEGKGVILLGMHLSTLDFCGAVLSSYLGFNVMYRRNKNRFIEAVMMSGRKRNYPQAIERDDVRSVINSLRQGQIVWYGPDQDYGRRNSVFAPFFGIETASITATARIARVTGARVVTFSHYRRPDLSGYDIFLDPALNNFPLGDDRKDAARINQIVEDAIRKSPEQYWWLHRRFKTRPDGEARPY